MQGQTSSTLDPAPRGSGNSAPRGIQWTLAEERKKMLEDLKVDPLMWQGVITETYPHSGFYSRSTQSHGLSVTPASDSKLQGEAWIREEMGLKPPT